MFDSIFINGINFALIAAMMGVSLVSGVIAAYIVSLRLRANKGFFVTAALMPLVVATAFCFLNVLIKSSTTSAITAIASVMVGMGLLRFRSAPAKAEEMLVLLLSTSLGAICGMGYVVYAVIVAIIFPLVYAALASLDIFKNKKFASEKLLKITVPESLEYSGAFAATFTQYLKEYEQVGIKTTGMGSMYLLSFRIIMKDLGKEKELIDKLRIKNGNLEIAILPFVSDPREL